jgi:c-di-GMP-binding flagellar brake protein YcgR
MKQEALRRHKRVPLAALANVSFEEDGAATSVQATVADISFGGVGLYIERQLADQTVVTIQVSFYSAPNIIKAETVRGRVVYSSPILGLYFIGIEFAEELDATSHPALFNRIQNTLKFS